jgi:hypothetical protein
MAHSDTQMTRGTGETVGSRVFLDRQACLGWPLAGFGVVVRRPATILALALAASSCTLTARDCDVLPRLGESAREQMPYLAETVGWPLPNPDDIRVGTGASFLYARKGRFRITLQSMQGAPVADARIDVTFADFNLDLMAQNRGAISIRHQDQFVPGRFPMGILALAAGMKVGGVRRLAIGPCRDDRELGECALLAEGGQVAMRLPAESTRMLLTLEHVCRPRVCALVRRSIRWGSTTSRGFFLRETSCS